MGKAGGSGCRGHWSLKAVRRGAWTQFREEQSQTSLFQDSRRCVWIRVFRGDEEKV